MTAERDWGFMHRDGEVDTTCYRTRRMASAAAADADDECMYCQGQGRHEVVVRDISEWRKP